MADESITRLITQKRLERVAVNVDHARHLIETARRHVRTARLLAEGDDPAMAFTAAYDAARKAVVAVLALEGLRVRPTGGAHHNTGVAGTLLVEDEALGEFEWLRQLRNATEYPDDDRPEATARDVAEAIPAADAIVEACAVRVGDHSGTTRD